MCTVIIVLLESVLVVRSDSVWTVTYWYVMWAVTYWYVVLCGTTGLSPFLR